MRKLTAPVIALTLLIVQSTSAGEITVPLGTKIYCELDQLVESKKQQFQIGDKVRVRVWRDVLISGTVAIPRGSPIEAHISFLKTAKVAGRKGKLEISADAVGLGDGREIPLSGGYGKHGKGRQALSWSLFAVVAWPLVFIKGKKAVLEPGTLFDAYTDQQFSVAVRDQVVTPKIDLSGLVMFPLSVEILYDELEGEQKPRDLPMMVRVCGDPPEAELSIDRINGSPIETTLKMEVGSFEQTDDCHTARATVALKPLVKHFRKGINRFDVSFQRGEERIGMEVTLDVQM